MNSILPYLAEVFLLYAVFYFFFRFILEKENQFTFNRFYLIATSILALIIPLASFKIGGSVPILNQVIAVTTINLPSLTINGSINSSANYLEYGSEALVGIYIGGLVYLVIKTSFALMHFASLMAKKTGIKKGKYIIFNTEGEFPSFSFLNYIFIDHSKGLSESDYQKILLHEQFHADRKHSFDLMYFQLLTILFWFNPLVWVYKNLTIETNEYSADAGVVRKSDFEEYASLIVSQVFKTSELQLVNYFYNNKTLKRIRKMKTINKTPNYYRLFSIIPMLFALILIFSCENETNNAFESELATVEEPKAVLAEGQVEEHIERLSSTLTDVSEDSVYNVVENMPEYPGGLEKFYEYIMTNMKYPESAKKEGIEGKVFVEFVIQKNGAVSNVKVVKGIGRECDAEAARVIRESTTKWSPASQEGREVNVRFILPITFKLS